MGDSTAKLLNMWDDVSKCDICFKQGERIGYCVGTGNINPIVMTIGYHPTFDGKSSDTRENTIGKSNLEFYDKMLHAIGITKELVWATNCVKCMGHRNPGIPNTCKKNLFVEVALINPRLIVALGEQAFHALMGDAEDWIPNKEYSYDGRKLITMVSPQTISQNPRYERYWTSAALIIKQHLKQPSLEWWL